MEKRYSSLEELPLAITIKDLMSILNIGRNTAYKFVRSGAVRTIRIGKQIRIPRDDVIGLFNSITDFPEAAHVELQRDLPDKEIERWVAALHNTKQMKELRK